ncbi:MAG: hypothetical protein LUD14_04640 [Clostridiales bacterium]|nr:hypothetical protein [Clostridiales bacterium]
MRRHRKRRRKKTLLAVIVVAAVVIATLLAYEAGEIGRNRITGEISDAGTGTDTGSDGTEEDGTISDTGNGTGDELAGSQESSENGTGAGEDIFFPYTSELDSLELVNVYDYSGYYIEDGTEDEIDSVAALVVTNTADEAIEFAWITLTADGEPLNFEVSLLPAGQTALVMEADRKSCSESASFSYVESEAAYLSELDMCEDQVSVSADDSGAVTVTNTSGSAIAELRLFYKNRIDTGEYIGGIAYTVKLEDLAAGESRTVYPSHFDPEYGVVMMLRIYDEE